MLQTKKRPTGRPRINLQATPTIKRPNEPSLLLQRLKELDDEFSRQTHQLAQLTRDFTKRFTRKV